MAKIVLDLSKFNVVSNYSEIARSVDGVIVRCGYRGLSNGKLTEDPSFGTHITNLMKYNVKVGVYFFTTAINTNEAAQEAAFTASLLDKYNVKVSFPVFVDSEMSNNSHTGRSDSLSKSVRTECIVAFCEKIQALGYVAGIYASDSWFVSQLNLSSITKYKLWVAKYSSTAPKYVSDYVGWQFTSNGSVPGIKSRVDLSHWYNEIGSSNNKINQINNSSTGGNPYVEPTINLKKGSKGEGVFWLQYELSKAGYSISIDGDFGPKTLEVVLLFQKSKGLTQDGIVGSITRNALKNNSKQIALIKFETGAGPIKLNSVKLYSNSKATEAKKELTGEYYIWNNKLVNNRVRICKDKAAANNLLKVVGWIDYNIISNNFG